MENTNTMMWSLLLIPVAANLIQIFVVWLLKRPANEEKQTTSIKNLAVSIKEMTDTQERILDRLEIQDDRKNVTQSILSDLVGARVDIDQIIHDNHRYPKLPSRVVFREEIAPYLKNKKIRKEEGDDEI